MSRGWKVALYGVGGIALLAAVPWVVGATLPAEHSISVSAEVAGSPVEVWGALADPASYPEWRPGVSRVEVVSGEGAPAVWREVTGEGAVTYRRLAAERPRRLVVEIADRNLPYGGRWTYRLEPSADGTRVTITEDGVVHSPLFRFFSRFVFGHEASARAFLDALADRMAPGG